MSALVEAQRSFACFGSTVTVLVTAEPLAAERAADYARDRLREWHHRFTRFDRASELSLLNADRRHTVPVSSEMLRLVALVIGACDRTGGLVDSTLVEELEAAGYATDLGTRIPLREALALAPPRRPARPRDIPGAGGISADSQAQTVTRRPGLRIDSGGLAKGMFADILAEELAHLPAFAIDCAGDVRVGGTLARHRSVEVEDPFGRSVLHRYAIAAGAAATSGIGRRAWLDADGRPAHHLLEPATGRPAFTGIVQVTALAPTAAEAEFRAKAALLDGPARAWGWLPHGGVVVGDDGDYSVVGSPALARSGS